MTDNNQSMDSRQSKFEQRLVGSRGNAITWAALFLWGAVSLILDTMDFTHNNPNWNDLFPRCRGNTCDFSFGGIIWPQPSSKSGFPVYPRAGIPRSWFSARHQHQ